MHHTPHVAFHEEEMCEVFEARIAEKRAEREEEERKGRRKKRIVMK